MKLLTWSRPVRCDWTSLGDEIFGLRSSERDFSTLLEMTNSFVAGGVNMELTRTNWDVRDVRGSNGRHKVGQYRTTGRQVRRRDRW